MTLEEMADFVCEKVGQTDDSSMALCKKFVRRRYQMIWDAALWRDTLVLWTQAIGVGISEVIAPAGVERVLKARWDTSNTLSYSSPESNFDLDPELFERTGTPLSFHELAPVINTAAQSVANGPFGVETTELAGEDGLSAVLVFERADGTIVRETIPINFLPTNSYGSSASALLSFTKPVTVGIVSFTAQEGANFFALQPDERQAPRFARIKLRGTPTEAKNLLCLGKRHFMDLTGDDDAPTLRNMDNALIAYAMSDMLEKQRQYGKARLKIEEAAAQMAIMRDLEKNQQANICRIIPQMVGGDSFDDYGSGFTSKSHW